MSSKITGLSAIVSVQPDDVLPVVDVHDTSMASSGTTKKMTLAQLPAARLLTPTAVKTGAYAAAAGDYVPCDTTSGSFTVTLPAAPADLSVVGVKQVIQGGTNTVTVACGGSDVFNRTGGGTTGTLTLLAQGMLLQYKASGGIWYITADDLPLAQLDARYVASVTAADASVVTGGTASAPTVRTGTLDVIATQHPAAADWSNNSHKVTNLANGTAAQDAAAYGQTLAGGSGTPMTTLGDLLYENSTPAPARLAGNVTGTRNYLTQTGTGAVSAAPAWGTIASGDLPAGTTGARGALQLDGTAGDIQPAGTQAAGAGGLAADSGHIHPATGWTPADYGLLACNMDDPGLAQATQVTTAGTVYLMRINIRAAITATNICFFVTSAGSGTSTTTFAGIYNSAGTLLSGSSDISSHLTSTGLGVCPLTTPQALSAGSFYWVALLTNFGTTQPTLAKSGVSAVASNAGLAAAQLRQAVNGTGASALSAITPSGNTGTNSFLLAAGIS